MNRNRRRYPKHSITQWQTQRVGDHTRYLLTEGGSTSVVARRNANAFWWEEPKEPPAPAASNPGEAPDSPEVALRRTIRFLGWVYER